MTVLLTVGSIVTSLVIAVIVICNDSVADSHL